MQKLLILIGIVFIVAGLLWPWLSRVGLGRLPGDIHIQRDGVDFYFPVTSAVLVSLLVSLVFCILRK